MTNDLISRSRLKAELDSWAKIIINPQYYHKEDADFVIDSQAAVDAVEVVHCEECMHFDCLQEETGVCWKTGLIKRRSGYCDEGERKREPDSMSDMRQGE